MARCDPEPGGGEDAGGGGNRRPARRLRYTAWRRRLFVEVLAQGYDTDAALAAAGLSWPEVCALRVRHPDFAAQIDEVIVAGFDRLEAALLRVAAAALAAEKPDVALAQAVMKLRRPARAVTAPASVSAKQAAADRAEREKRVRQLMDNVAQLHAAQARGRGDGVVDERPDVESGARRG